MKCNFFRTALQFVLGFLISMAMLSCSIQSRRPEFKPQHSPKRPGRVVSPTPGKPAEVLTEPQSGRETPATPTPPTLNSFQNAEIQAAQGKYLEALGLYVSVLSEPYPIEQLDLARAKAVDLIETKLVEGQLREIGNSGEFGFARGYALLRLGKSAMDRRDYGEAREYLTKVTSLMPGTDAGIRASDFLGQMDILERVQSKTIGVVLPLSGKNSFLGRKALRGVELGLGLHQSSSNFRLAVIDSEGNPDTARRGVERLIKEDNVIAVVGSLLSKTASSVAAKANEYGVPSIGLSQKSGLTDVGPYVFSNSLTSEVQVRYLVKVAMAQGMRRFAILYPNDPYGTEYANMFWDEVLARGGVIASAQSYDPRESDFRHPIQRLVGTFYVEGRLDEFKVKSKSITESAHRSRAARESVNLDDILQPLVDFDAIFIPDSAKIMGQLSSFLSYAGVKNLSLLGTNLWNSPGLAKRAGHFSDRLLFVDGLWLDPYLKANSRFYQEYRTIFEEEPGFAEFQAYDASLLLRQLLVQSANTREELADKLLRVKRFPGSLGELNMNENRELSRPLTALSLDKNGEIRPFYSSNRN